MSGDDRLHTSTDILATETWELFENSEYVRKLFRKSLMKFIDMPNEYKRYTMDLEQMPETISTVTTYYLSLRKNCKSTYTKKLISLNKNYITNTGGRRYGEQGILVQYNLEEFLKTFLREYKIITLMYG